MLRILGSGFGRGRAVLAVVLVVALSATVVPLPGAGASARQFERSVVEPWPVPVVVGREAPSPIVPAVVSDDDLVTESLRQALEGSVVEAGAVPLPNGEPVALAAANGLQARLAQDPAGSEYPTIVYPKSTVIRPVVDLKARRSSGDVLALLDYAIFRLTTQELLDGLVNIEARCGAASSQWPAGQRFPHDSDARVPAELISESGWYIWCVRHWDQSRSQPWASQTVRIADASELGLFGSSPNRAQVKGVDVATGNWVIERTDLSIPSLGPELAIRRVYNSSDHRRGAFGFGWSFNYEMRLEGAGDAGFVLRGADGSATLYRPVAGENNEWRPNPDESDGASSVLTFNGNYRLTHRDGGFHEFNPLLRLRGIADARGNRIQLDYDDVNQLEFVTDVETGRRLSFTWSAGRITAIDAPNPAGSGTVTWTYNYGEDGSQFSHRLLYACDPRPWPAELLNEPGVDPSKPYACEYYLQTNGSTATKIGGIYNQYSGAAFPTVAEQVYYDDKGRVQIFAERPSDDETNLTVFDYPNDRALYDDFYGVLVCAHAGIVDAEIGVELPPQNFSCSGDVADASHRWRYVFDPTLRLINKQRRVARDGNMVDESRIQYLYNDGRRTSVLDALGNRSQFFYDSNGNLQATKNGEGEFRFFHYDPNNDMTAECDNRARVAGFAEPVAGSGVLPDGFFDKTNAQYCVLFEYNEFGEVEKRTETINPGNVAVTTWTYDANGQVETVTVPVARDGIDGLGIEDDPPTEETTTFTYRSTSNKTLETRTSPSGLVTTYNYNSWGQPTSVRSQAPNRVPQRTATTVYNEIGLAVASIGPMLRNVVTGDEAALMVETKWTPLGLPHSITERSITRISPDADGSYPVSSGIEERVTSFEYDLLGREVATTDAADGVTRRTFDRHGNVQRVCDARENCVETVFEEDNLPEQRVALNYEELNEEGQRVTVTRAVIEEFDHDAAGRLISTQIRGTAGREDRAKIVYQYDNADRLLRRLLDDFDDTGRMRRLSEDVYDTNTVNSVGRVTDFGSGYVVQRSTGGHFDSIGKKAFVTTNIERTLSGLPRTETIGVHPSFNNPIVIQRAYAASGRMTTETRTRAQAPDNKSRTRYGFEHGQIVETQVAKYLDRTDSENNNLTDNVSTCSEYDARGYRTASTTERKQIQVEVENGQRKNRYVCDFAAEAATYYSNDVAGRTTNIQSPQVRVIDENTRSWGEASFENLEHRIGYNAWGEITHRLEVTDPENDTGNLTVTAYDTLGRVTHITHPTDRGQTPTERFHYDANGNQIRYDSTRGMTSTYVFDDFNRVVEESLPFPWRNESVPAPAGAAAPDGHFSYAYDRAGNLIESTDVVGTTTTRFYNDYDLLEEETVETQSVTELGKTAPARTYTSTYTYDSNGHLQESVEWGLRQFRVWNPAGELTRLHIGTLDNAAGALNRREGRTWSFTYNQLGDVLTEVDPADRLTYYCYDGRGNAELTKLYGPVVNAAGSIEPNCTSDEPVRAEDPENDESGQNQRVLVGASQTRFDRQGRVKATIDASASRTSYGYDRLGRLTYSALSLEPHPVNDDDVIRSVTSFGYDRTGNLTYLSDGNRSVTRYKYNSWGQRTDTIDPLGNTWTADYDTGGLVEAETDPTGAIVTHFYDHLGLRVLSDATDKNGIPSGAIYYDYDDAGRLTSSRRDNQPAQTFAYDGKGDLFVSDGPQGRTEITYHAKTGLPDQRNDPAAGGRHIFTWAATNQTLDLIGHWDAVSTRGTTYAYHDDGRLKTETRKGSGGASNAYQRTFTYDGAGRLSTELGKKDVGADGNGGTEVHRADYTYNINGELDTKTVETDLNLGTRTFDYDYDLASRLLKWTVTESNSEIYSETYTYDKAGNRKSLDSSDRANPQTWNYDRSNRITTGPEGTYTWNVDGTPAEIESSAGTTSFAFNDFGELTQHAPAANDTINYTYDGLGRLASRQQTGDPTQTFGYAGLAPDPSSIDETTSYGRGPTGQLTSYKAPNQAGNPTTRQVYLDNRGDVAHERDRDGATTYITQHNPFGTPWETAGASYSNLGYQGDYTDPTTGDINMGARWYNPNNATFRSRDTFAGHLRTPISLNRYTYANNNPARYWDPTGYDPEFYGDHELERIIDGTQSTSSEVREASFVALAAVEDEGQLWILNEPAVLTAEGGALDPILGAGSYSHSGHNPANHAGANGSCGAGQINVAGFCATISDSAVGIAQPDSGCQSNCQRSQTPQTSSQQQQSVYVAHTQDASTQSDYGPVEDFFRDTVGDRVTDAFFDTGEAILMDSGMVELAEGIRSEFSEVPDNFVTVTSRIPDLPGAALDEARSCADDPANGFNPFGDPACLNTAGMFLPGKVPKRAPNTAQGLRFADEGAQGFGSMSSFKRAYGSAGPDAQWHHIVEQNPTNLGQFGAESIHNTSNVIALDTAVHRQVSGYYSSIQPFTGGQTVRQWVSAQPFDTQRQIGLDVLDMFGAAG